MINYSKEAMNDYVSNIIRIQHELSEVPTDIINYTDLHWLISTALPDLLKAVKKEWEK